MTLIASMAVGAYEIQNAIRVKIVGAPVVPWSQLSVWERSLWIEAARSALETAAASTDIMDAAGADIRASQRQHDTEPEFLDDARAIWRGMVAAALREK